MEVSGIRCASKVLAAVQVESAGPTIPRRHTDKAVDAAPNGLG